MRKYFDDLWNGMTHLQRVLFVMFVGLVILDAMKILSLKTVFLILLWPDGLDCFN